MTLDQALDIIRRWVYIFKQKEKNFSMTIHGKDGEPRKIEIRFDEKGDEKDLDLE